jgi:meso-butanediol dehydrogenase/(S,S)-butanediol dehydrogenase/diacetyl reductase
MAGRMQGRVALVTGGGGGIGEATARLFVEEGGSVALVDTSREALDAAAKALGDQALGIVADVSKETQAKRAVEEALARFGKLDALVNVAGVRVYRSLAEASADDWQLILGVNVLGTAYCCKAALPALRKGGGATIVNVSSVYGVMGRKGMGQYDTTKAAVLGMTRALAVEEAPHAIRVNAVLPGSTITPYHVKRAAAQGQSEAELRKRTANENLLGRWAEPREVGYAILFLSCAESSYITGTELLVDAGRSIL